MHSCMHVRTQACMRVWGCARVRRDNVYCTASTVTRVDLGGLSLQVHAARSFYTGVQCGSLLLAAALLAEMSSSNGFVGRMTPVRVAFAGDACHGPQLRHWPYDTGACI